jgi:hypothetical protein
LPVAGEKSLETRDVFLVTPRGSCYNILVNTTKLAGRDPIPSGVHPHFQEYDIETLDLKHDANLIIQRLLEFGTWEEVRWLFATYGTRRVRSFLRRYGERWLRPVSFHYWRKLLRLRQWQSSPFPTTKGEIWNR